MHISSLLNMHPLDDMDNSASIILVRDGKQHPAIVFPNLQVGIISPMEYTKQGGSFQVVVMVGKVVNGLVVPLSNLRPGIDYNI